MQHAWRPSIWLSASWRTARRVDQGHFAEVLLLEALEESVLQDELGDEVRGLEQGVALADVLAEVLVEIAKEARVGATEAEARGLGRGGAEERDQGLGGLRGPRGDAAGPERELLREGARQRPQLCRSYNR